MAALDAEDIERIEHMDLDLLRRRIAWLTMLPLTGLEQAFVGLVERLGPEALIAAERHQVALLCWRWRRHGLPRALVPRINPADPLSPELLAVTLDCTPTVAAARMEARA